MQKGTMILTKNGNKSILIHVYKQIFSFSPPFYVGLASEFASSDNYVQQKIWQRKIDMGVKKYDADPNPPLKK